MCIECAVRIGHKASLRGLLSLSLSNSTSLFPSLSLSLHTYIQQESVSPDVFAWDNGLRALHLAICQKCQQRRPLHNKHSSMVSRYVYINTSWENRCLEEEEEEEEERAGNKGQVMTPASVAWLPK